MAPPSDAGGAHRRSHRVEQRRVGIPRDCCLPHDFHGKICFYEQTLADDSDLVLAERAALTRPEARIAASVTYTSSLSAWRTTSSSDP